MASKPSKAAPNAESQELSLLVQDMVDQMNTKFTRIGESIMGRMNEMNARMDELELSIVDLMNQAGLEPASSSALSPKSDSSAESKLGHI